MPELRPVHVHLPREVIETIASFASINDAKQVALVNSTWQAAAEKTIWYSLKIDTQHNGQGYDGWQIPTVGAWRDRLTALRARPARALLVKELKTRSFDRCLPVMRELLQLCAQSITSIEQIYNPTEVFSALDQSSLARALAAGPLLPRCTSLRLRLAENWEAEVIPALLVTPRLVNLHIDVFPDGATFADINAEQVAALRLPNLQAITFKGLRWEQGLAAILDAAPRVKDLIFLHEGVVWWDKDHEAFRKVMQREGLERVDIRGSFMSTRFCQTTRDPAFGACFPGLKYLLLSGKLGPYCLPRHPDLRSISFTCSTYPTRHTHHIGTVSSDEETGMVAPWMIRLFDDLPSLEAVYLLPDAESPSTGMLGGLSLRSYASEGAVLYDIVCRAQSPMRLLGAAHLALDHATIPSSYGSISFDDDARWEVSFGNGAEMSPSGVNHLTSYKGLPLPKKLFDAVINLAEGQAAASQACSSASTRDRRLPEDGWRMLKEWREGVMQGAADRTRDLSSQPNRESEAIESKEAA